MEELWNGFRILHKDQEGSMLEKNRISKMLDYFVTTLHGEKDSNDETNGNIGDFLVCYCCSELLIDPVTLLCGHVYCKKCLQKRDNDDYIELCVKCDKNSIKRTRWCIFRRSLLENYRTNVILQSIIQEVFSDELRAITFRLEGNQFFSAKNYDRAAVKYEEALMICPSSFKSWSNLSRVKSCQNLHSEALIAAQKSVQICPFWEKGYYNEGIAYQGVSDKLNSAFSFFKYLLLEPTSFTVREKLLEVTSEILFTENGSVNDEEVETFAKLLLEKGYEFCSTTKCNRVNQILEEKLKNSMALELLQSRLSCALCCRVFYQATTTPCGHTFCTPCLERSLDYRHTCSICRTSLVELITVKPKPIDAVIDGLTQKYFPQEYEESRLASTSESTIVKYETEEIVTIPIFVCMATYPTLECPLHVFEPRYKLMLRRCLDSPEKTFGMCMFDEIEKFKQYGTLLQTTDSKLLDDGRMLVNSVGIKRFQVLDRGTRDGYATARVRLLKDKKCDITDDLKSFHKSVFNESEDLLKSLPLVIQHSVRLNYGDIPALSESEEVELASEHGPKWVWHMLKILFNSDDDVEAVLKSTNLYERLEMVKDGLNRIRHFPTG